MRIGFVSYWFERGQAYVTKNVIQAIQDDCEVFVFARSAGILKTDGEWAIPNLTTHDQYQIPKHVLRKWITDNNLDAVFFNEEYDLRLVYMAKEMGVKTVGIYYWELFDPRTAGPCNTAYDAIICPTKCSFEKFKSFGMTNIHYIKWGVDLDVFKPAIREPNEKVRFFHPAGWGGMHNRRGTEFVIDAFRMMENDNAELFIHSQKVLTRETQDIDLHCGTVSREELINMYQESDVAILPSKWEGLGLTFLEAIGCGLPIITVCAPPMNEFLDWGETEDFTTGYCCSIAHEKQYPDIFVPGMFPNIADMAGLMDAITDRALLEGMRKATLFRRSEWDWRENSQPLRNLILELGKNAGGNERGMGKTDLDAITTLIQNECPSVNSVEIDTQEYARFHKICADPMISGEVLDVGCKHGTLTMMLAENYPCVGVDKNAANIEICEKQREVRGYFPDVIPFHQAEIKSLPFDDETFGTVILAQVIEHLRDPEDLKELMRILRPDGCLIITTNVGFAHWDPDHRWFFLPDKTYEMLRGGWFFMERNGEPAFMKQGTVVPFGAFIEKYTGESYGYQVYNNHDNPHHSLEIYARVYKDEAILKPFPELPGDEVIMEDYSSVKIQTTHATAAL